MENNLIKNYFKNEAEMYIFILNYLDSEDRTKYLGISRSLYTSKRLATEWYVYISNIIKDYKHQDRNEAIKNLGRLYSDMIDF